MGDIAGGNDSAPRAFRSKLADARRGRRRSLLNAAYARARWRQNLCLCSADPFGPRRKMWFHAKRRCRERHRRPARPPGAMAAGPHCGCVTPGSLLPKMQARRATSARAGAGGPRAAQYSKRGARNEADQSAGLSRCGPLGPVPGKARKQTGAVHWASRKAGASDLPLVLGVSCHCTNNGCCERRGLDRCAAPTRVGRPT